MRKEILETLLKNGKLNHYCLNKKWYEKHSCLNIYEAIYRETSFLDSYNPSLRERIYYLEKNLKTPQLCPYCKFNKLYYRPNKVCFTRICRDEKCVKQMKSEIVKLQHENMSPELKEERGRKISVKNGRPTKEKWGEEVANRVAQISRERLQGKTYEEIFGEKKAKQLKQAKSTKWKKQNPMHNLEIKKKVTVRGKKTRSTSEYKEKIVPIRKKAKEKHSATMKRKILEGSFTPNIRNRYTGISTYFIFDKEEKKFRSSWEAIFWLKNQHLIYEKVRVPYFYKGESKVYIVDFEDKENKILYEIKPSNLTVDSKVVEKTKACIEWCKNNNYQFIIVDETWFKKDENIKLEDLVLYPKLQQVLRKLKS